MQTLENLKQFVVVGHVKPGTFVVNSKFRAVPAGLPVAAGVLPQPTA